MDILTRSFHYTKSEQDNVGVKKNDTDKVPKVQSTVKMPKLIGW